VLREKDISDEFLAVFHVKVGEHPTRKSPHLVKRICLQHVICPALGTPGITSPCPEVVDVKPFGPWSVLLVAAKVGERGPLLGQLAEHWHQVKVWRPGRSGERLEASSQGRNGWKNAGEKNWNQRHIDLTSSKRALFVGTQSGGEEVVSQSARMRSGNNAGQDPPIARSRGVFPDQGDQGEITKQEEISRYVESQTIDAGLLGDEESGPQGQLCPP